MSTTTRYVAVTMDPESCRLLDRPLPDAIFAVPRDMRGEHFLHLRQVVPFDQGHDWSIRGGRAYLSLACLEQRFLVCRYGPEPSCDCGHQLPQGSVYCPMCGTPTSSIVESP